MDRSCISQAKLDLIDRLVVAAALGALWGPRLRWPNVPSLDSLHAGSTRDPGPLFRSRPAGLGQGRSGSRGSESFDRPRTRQIGQAGASPAHTGIYMHIETSSARPLGPYSNVRAMPLPLSRRRVTYSTPGGPEGPIAVG